MVLSEYILIKENRSTYIEIKMCVAEFLCSMQMDRRNRNIQNTRGRKFFAKKTGRWLLLLLLLFEIGGRSTVVYAVEAEKEIQEPEGLYAQSAVLMDADSGRILFSKNGQEERAMASTTKIMTCILALENGNLDDTVTASAYAASQPEVHLGVREGEQFCLRDLLYSLMLESHNDAAVVIAEHVGIDVPGFADMMNEKARELGCEHTHFVTPNGLDGTDDGGTHHTTAEDLARIMKYCIMDSPQKKAFLEITGTENYSFADVGGGRSFSCYNHNAFLKMMEGALSGKTGFTGEAGYCYVGALQREERTFIVSLLACGWPNNKGYKWADTKKLMTYGIEAFHYRDIHQETETAEITVLNGIPNESRLNGKSSVCTEVQNSAADTEVFLLRDDETVEISIEEKPQLTAPVFQGESVGKVVYRIGDEVLLTETIVTAESVNVRDFVWCAEQIMHQFFYSLACK